MVAILDTPSNTFFTSLLLTLIFVGWDVSVGIATCYRLGGRGSNPGGSEIFHPVHPALWPAQPPVQCVQSIFPGDKAIGAWR